MADPSTKVSAPTMNTPTGDGTSVGRFTSLSIKAPPAPSKTPVGELLAALGASIPTWVPVPLVTTPAFAPPGGTTTSMPEMGEPGPPLTVRIVGPLGLAALDLGVVPASPESRPPV